MLKLFAQSPWFESQKKKTCSSLSATLDLVFGPKWELTQRLAKLSKLALVAGDLRISLYKE